MMSVNTPQRRVSPSPEPKKMGSTISIYSDSRDAEVEAALDESGSSSTSLPARISSLIPDKTTLFRISSIDSSSVAFSEVEQEPSWTCPRCSYLNVDAKNERCALCGTRDDEHIAESNQRKQQRRMEKQKVFSWRTNPKLNAEDPGAGLTAPVAPDVHVHVSGMENREPALLLSSTKPGLKRPDSEPGEVRALPTEPTRPLTDFFRVSPAASSSRRPEPVDDGLEQLQPPVGGSSRSIIRTSSSTKGTESSVGGLMLPSGLTRQDALLITSPPVRTESIASRKSEMSDTTVRVSNRTGLSRPPRPTRPQPQINKNSFRGNLHPALEEADEGDDAPPTRSRTMPPSPPDPDTQPQQKKKLTTMRQYHSAPDQADYVNQFFFKQLQQDKEQPTSTRSIESPHGRPLRHADDETGASPLPVSSRSLMNGAMPEPPTRKPSPLPVLRKASSSKQPQVVESTQRSMSSRTPPHQETEVLSATDYPLVYAVDAPPTSCHELPQDRSCIEEGGGAPAGSQASRGTSAKFANCSMLRSLVLLAITGVVGAVATLIVLLLNGRNDAVSAEVMPPSAAPVIVNNNDTTVTMAPTSATPDAYDWVFKTSVEGQLGFSVSVGGPVGDWIAAAGYDFVQVYEYISLDNVTELGAAIFFGSKNENNDQLPPPRVSLSAERRRMAVTTNDGHLFVYQRRIGDNGNWAEAFAFNTTVWNNIGEVDQKSIVPTTGDISGSGLIVAGASLIHGTKGAVVAIQVWDLENATLPQKYLQIPADLTAPVLDLGLSYEGDVMAVLANQTVTTFRRGEDSLKDWVDDTPIRLFGNGRAVLSMVLSGDGLTLVVSTVEELVSVYAYISGDIITSSYQWKLTDTIKTAGTDLAVSYDGETIAIGNEDENSSFRGVSVWRRETSVAGEGDYEYIEVLEGSAPPAGFGVSIAMPKNREWDLIAIGAMAEGDNQNGHVGIYQELRNNT